LKFRNGEKYGFWIKKTDNTVIYLKRFYSHYFRAFDNKISLRHSCYNCQLACQERIGDITIGDFWGLNKGELIKKADKGISIIICSTNKGKKIIEETQSYLFLERHDIAETLDMNPRLSSPPEISKAVWKFRQAYLNTKDFNKSVNSVLGMKYKIYAIKRKLKKITVLDYLYSLIKKM